MRLNKLFLILLLLPLSFAQAAEDSNPTQDSPINLALAADTDLTISTSPIDLTQPPAPIREALIVAPEYILEGQDQSVIAASEAEYSELSALADEDVWQRIRSGFAMKPLNSQLIKQHEKWYARHPEYVLRMSERANRYLYYIVEEVERRGMPTEIALLPIIESAFNPGANSVASASGIWQFIPSTGKHFGMEQNWWYDGRRDIIGATNGALDYLEKLHKQFGDWELALAAYNWGENAVARAQARNRKYGKPTDYSHLKMPRETRNYVPKLLAIKNIVSDPEKYKLTLTAIPNRPYFEAVTPSKPMDVKIAAELAEVSIEEFLALNPGHNRPVILQDQAEVLLLPVDKVAVFRTNLENNDQRLVSWRAYESNKGESFADIANNFDISLEQLRKANGLSKYARLSNGQTLLVPAGAEEEDNAFSPFNMHATAVQEMSGFRYVVRRGDTISGIARKFKISQRSLIAMNNGRSFLRIGQKFTIMPGSSRRTSSRISSKGIYVVRSGDTISGIARKFGISQSSLIALNHGRSFIRVGQKFSIPPSNVQQASAQTNSKVMKVANHGKKQHQITSYQR
ncbi:MAG: LysM peptidoglycan-binding domain-containing protein [Gammaproteobacteria bacterium]|nr:LysM peptidoglycan-binding domain-containing protein [Gammaproteobacteria bacterium]MBU1625328.1 LysM peptidoglycan-binding domain-containing protein [Gammaproteobacteria bacterium]MBU1981588.1 LysM peptidoglycan-binding domain-containing protein [Gammaproteobacteria bacterium]